MIIAMLLVVIAMQAAQTPAPPPDPSPPELPVSIARIRAALERPDLLALPQITPDFVVSVQERERFDKLVPPLDFRSGPVPPGGLYAYEQLQRSGLSTVQPLILVDLIAIARGIGRAYSAQSAAAAREDVRRAIADYCAAQPGGGTGIAICAK